MKSATPYMLVYRKRTSPASNTVGDPIAPMNEDAEEASFSAIKVQRKFSVHLHTRNGDLWLILEPH